MGWVNWPSGIPTTSTGIGSLGTAYSFSYNDKQVWDWLEQGWRAERERHVPFNCTMMWPPGDAWGPFSNGTVASIVNNGDGTMTVTPANGFSGWDVSEDCTSPKFAPGYNCGTCLPNIPTNYDLIITTDATFEDPFQVYRGSITAITYAAGPPTSGTITITSQTILDCITANYLASLATLNGAAWYIIKSGSPFTSERLPDKPDPAAEWIGTTSTGGTTTITVSGTATTYSSLSDLSASWPNLAPHDATTYEVVVFGSDSALHRETIVGNNGNLLWFTHRSYTASGPYRIVVASTVGKPGRTILPMWAYYTGLSTQYYTHLTDGKNDTIGAWNIAGNQVAMQIGDVCGGGDPPCEGTTYGSLDSDLFFPTDGTCNGQSAGKFVGVNYWKSFHALQKDVEELCTSYLPYLDYSNYNHNAIHNWTTAGFFLANNINAWGCSYTHVDGSNLTVTGVPSGDDIAPSFPIPCYYQVAFADGSVSGGSATLSSATNLTGGPFPDPSVTTPAPTGLTLSLAWSRAREEQLLHMWNHTGFIPTLDDGAIDPPTVVDNGDGTFTPDCGIWEKRAKSNTYLTRQANGMAVNGSRAFIDQRMCRWVGDNANNPSIFPVTAIGDSSAALVPYYDKFFRGTYGSIIQGKRKAKLSGTITGWQAGTTHGLTDADKNWWIDGVSNGTSLHVETGTVTSGTSTSITTTIDTSANPAIYWWASRFIGFSDPSPYTEFICEITHSDTVVKVPITSTVTGAGVVINFDAVTGFTPATGSTVTITEPAYEINRFQDRIVTIVDTNTNRLYTSTITFNDFNTLFFGQIYQAGEAVTITPALDGTWNYSIADPDCGGVWKWNADTERFTEVKGGSDAERLGVTSPENFVKNSRGNLANLFRDYGAMQPGDLLTDTLLAELQTCINSMLATRQAADGWYMNAVAGTPEVYEGTVLNNLASNSFGTFDDEFCYGGPDPRYPYPASVCDTTVEDNEAAVVYLLQPGSCLWSNPPCIDQTGWYTLPAGDGAGSAPSVTNAYSSAFQFDGTGTLVGGIQGCSQTAISAYLRISNICTLFSCNVDFYNFATASGSCPGTTPDAILGPDLGNGGTTCQPCTLEFDAFGQSVIYRKWDKFSSATIDGTGKAVSSKLGDVTEPFTPSPVIPCDDGTSSATVFDPPAYEYDASSNDGYLVTDQTTILKWGFSYV